MWAAAGIALLAAGCGGGDGSSDSGPIRGKTITVWNNESQPDRMKSTQAILDDFTRRTGVKTKLVPVPEDQLSSLTINAAAAGELPDVVLATPVGDSHVYTSEKLFDAKAAQAVIDKLGRDTFSKPALELVSQGGVATGVPSDGWGQLLIYRRDLFEKAGLRPPKTLDEVQAAAEKLDSEGVAGIALGTAPGDGFTAETFEHIALASGCQLVDDGGAIKLDSPPCVDAFRRYGALAGFSVEGSQDLEAVRGTYFAGQAAMMFWSPFLLDGMAGLRDDTKPSCPECKRDPKFLASNSGLIGPLRGAGKPSQFGSVSTFNISVDANVRAAQALVEFMMTDGYVRWLGLSPQGKYPTRLGDQEDPDRFTKAWAKLESGVDRKATLTEAYSDDSIDSLAEGAGSFDRWGFAQGEGALIGALSAEQPIAKAVADVVGGKDPAEAAKEAQATVEEIQDGLG